MAHVGRNDPCPCGSGKKYKKCCLDADRAKESSGGRSPLHALDEFVVADILGWARDRYGDAFTPRDDFPYEVELPGPDAQIFVPWSAYEYPVEDDERIVDIYLAEEGPSLPLWVRAWVEAQSRAWVSAWEMLEVEPGKGFRARDLLTHEERFVHEVNASMQLVARDVVLGRIVDFEGVSIVCGMHPSPLPPEPGALFAEAVRKELARGWRWRKKDPLSIAKLQDVEASSLLIGFWQKIVEGLRARPMPKLTNTDGDDLMMVTDHYELAKGAHPAVEARLHALPGAELEAEETPGTIGIVFMRPGNPIHKSWDNTIIGRAVLSSHSLRLEANSIKRADALRRQVEEACGELLRFKERKSVDPAKEVGRRGGRAPAPRAPSAEELAVLREMKERHYTTWLDTELPALNGKTPRQAMKSARLRGKLDMLLKQAENMEGREPEDRRFNISALRAELGL